MKLSHFIAVTLLIANTAYSDFIAKDSDKASQPSKWKVGDVLEGVGQITAVEPKDGKYFVKATREGYKVEIMVMERPKK